MRYDLRKLYDYFFAIGLPDSKDELSEQQRREIATLFSGMKKDAHAFLSEANPRLANILFGYIAAPSDILSDIDHYVETVRGHNPRIEGALYYDETSQLPPEVLRALPKCILFCAMINAVFEEDVTTYHQPYQHAIRILIMYGDHPDKWIDHLQEYLDRFHADADRPFIEALSFQVPDGTYRDSWGFEFGLDKWRDAIASYGPEALRYFWLAPSIAKGEHGRTWFYNLERITQAALSCKYRRAAENYPLAKIMFRLDGFDYNFDRVLTAFQHCKKEDYLPQLAITGEFPRDQRAATRRRYVLVKVPPNDVGNYLLKEICVGGADREWVEPDGVRDPGKANYVLLRSKAQLEAKEHAGVKPLLSRREGSAEQQINYDHFDIVGYGHAGFSAQGNLMFDFWRNQYPKRDDEISAELLKIFSMRVTQGQEASITRITMVEEKHMPQSLASVRVSCPEQKAGALPQQYSRQKNQVQLYCNEEHRADFFRKLEDRLVVFCKELKEHKYSPSQLLNWFGESLYSERALNAVLSFLTVENMQRLPQTFPNYPWEAISVLHVNKLYARDIAEVVVADAANAVEKAHQFVEAFNIIKGVFLKNDPIVRRALLTSRNPAERAQWLVDQKLKRAPVQEREEKVDEFDRCIKAMWQTADCLRASNESNKILLFLRQLRHEVGRLPDKKFRVFTDAEKASLKHRFILDIDRLADDVPCLDVKAAEEKLFLTLLSFHRQLVEAGNQLYLDRMNAFYRQHNFSLPQDLNSHSVFRFDVEPYKSSFAQFHARDMSLSRPSQTA